MPNFFVPFTDTFEQAEEMYSMFRRQNPYEALPGRLFSVDFTDHGKISVAEVGKEIDGRHEKDGLVLAIIEGTGLVTIHTVARGGLSGTPILVSPDEVRHRLYFDDFPARV